MMRYFLIIAAIALTVVLLTFTQKLMNPLHFATVSAQQFSDTLDSDSTYQLVDVRTPAEYGQGFICNAVLIDVQSVDFDSIVKADLDPSRPLAVYCRSGVRSKQAIERLSEMGYHGIELDGGILNWNRYLKH